MCTRDEMGIGVTKTVWAELDNRTPSLATCRICSAVTSTFTSADSAGNGMFPGRTDAC